MEIFGPKTTAHLGKR